MNRETRQAQANRPEPPEPAGALRARQLAAALTTVKANPGEIAYLIGCYIPAEVTAAEAAAGMLARSLPVPQTLTLLRQLERAGKVYCDTSFDGQPRWYPLG